MGSLTISASGDSAVFCQVGNGVSPTVNIMVYSLEKRINQEEIKGIIETVPSYNGLMIYFNPLLLDSERLREIITSVSFDEPANSEKESSRTIIIPVFYGKEYGPDLEIVAGENNLSTKEVISIHSGTDYRIYMLGFTPGFPYLGGMDMRIATPRKKEPRLKIAAGSVGIAGEQTGIYPIESPGGWQIIGRTPLRLFNPGSDTPFLLSPGISLRFREIGIEEYNEIHMLVNKMEYLPEFIQD